MSDTGSPRPGALPSRLGRSGWLVLALVFGGSGACAGNGNGMDPDPGPQGPCPDPGPGIEVGGSPGSQDVTATPQRRVVLMGGGPEHDGASSRFLEGAAGGDVVILRASGSLTSYPDYFMNALSPSPAPASAVTVKSEVPGAADDPAVLCWVGGAEAIWLAGGNQWDYLGGWPPALHSALAQANARGVAMGGTSAGAASLGEAAFDAKLGTVTSAEALANPLLPGVSLTYPSFAAAELQGMLVDSHFMDRDREGRLLAFLARFLTEKSRSEVVGIGLDERVALVIREGTYRVFGPPGQFAWFYRVRGPATLEANRPLGLSGILRAQRSDGDEGSWPLDFDALPTQALQVEDGVVGTL